MPFEFVEVRWPGCMFVRWSGPFTAAEIRDYLETLVRTDAYREGANVLHDGRCWQDDIATDEVLQLANDPPLTARLGGPRRRAAFLVENPQAFGVIRVLATLRSRPDLEIAVFRQLGDAKVWLGLRGLVGDPFRPPDRPPG